MRNFFMRQGSSRMFFKPKRGRIRLLAFLVLVAGGSAVYLAFFHNAAPKRSTPLIEACPPWAEQYCDPSQNLFARTEEDPSEEVLEGSIKPGQTLGGILGDYVDAGALAGLDNPDDFSFASIQSGQPYRLTVRDKELVTFEYDISPTETLVIDGEKGDLQARVETKQCETRTGVMAGTVASSLFKAVEEAGGDAQTAVALADVFASDIDFCRDVQPGDTFRAVVEKRYAEGKLIGIGRVLAARYVNEGKTYEGFALLGRGGKPEYFDADGRALRKAFLRAPLSFLRITSRFTSSRLHPILKVRKPHYGVDYAAPTGTPVWSVGAGVVVERGRNRAAGNYVTVRHSRTWVTRYNHFSRFAKGIRKGSKVAQGQVIGYVGQTGFATGPHLDFRIYKNGKPVNALANPKMQADPLPASKLARFKRQVEKLEALLDQAPQTKDLAARDTPDTKGIQ
ncbi:Peptidase M23 [Solidesulfovibrio fructosivorans JJ]]|uniref:Peptidase M23 n=2 Tax=Solidesulfovibrio fructosivorans TaxID=878 RepID=E1JUP2_SOLFR|nr:Peptidase M23 [Solidesulfovibrio fructosivorans JJ]]